MANITYIYLLYDKYDLIPFIMALKYPLKCTFLDDVENMLIEFLGV